MPDQTRFRLVLPLIGLGLVASLASAAPDVLIDDDFDDASLDPAWAVTMECADGYAASEAGSEFTMTDINATCVDTGIPVDWARLVLRRDVPPTGDLLLQADLSWSSDGGAFQDRAMQSLFISLRDENDELVAIAGPYDAWYDWSGSVYAACGGNAYYPGYDTMPHVGSASIEIERTDGDVVIRWNGAVVVTASDADPVVTLTIDFRHYAYEAGNASSHFGTLAVDRILLESIPAGPVSDVDGDGVVGIGDLLAMLAAWGTCPDPDACPADVNDDGQVDIADLLQVLADWGAGAPGP